MSLSLVQSRALLGLDAPAVTVEVHLANGLPSFTLVGLADVEVVTDIKVLSRDNKFCPGKLKKISSVLETHFRVKSTTLKFCPSLKIRGPCRDGARRLPTLQSTEFSVPNGQNPISA